MHNPRPRNTANALQAVPAMVQKRIHERPAMISRPRMHDKPRRLIHDDQMLILEGNG